MRCTPKLARRLCVFRVRSRAASSCAARCRRRRLRLCRRAPFSPKSRDSQCGRGERARDRKRGPHGYLHLPLLLHPPPSFSRRTLSPSFSLASPATRVTCGSLPCREGVTFRPRPSCSVSSVWQGALPFTPLSHTVALREEFHSEAEPPPVLLAFLAMRPMIGERGTDRVTTRRRRVKCAAEDVVEAATRAHIAEHVIDGSLYKCGRGIKNNIRIPAVAAGRS